MYSEQLVNVYVFVGTNIRHNQSIMEAPPCVNVIKIKLLISI